MAAPTDILPPRYRDPQLIGRGGMGEIYRAGDETLGRRVAIKILADRYAQDESVRRRFKREALSAARLSSEPNVVDIYDVGEWNDRPFIVMEYLPGGSLDDVLRREGAQEPGRALAWLEQAGHALDAALLTGRGEEPAAPAPRTVVTTAPGPTVVETVTTSPPTQQEGRSGAQLGFALMEEGRFEEALPLLEEAVRKLSGTGDEVEAFALYNLAFTKLQLGQCGEDIPQMLDRSEEIQGHRKEIDRARRDYEKACGD